MVFYEELHSFLIINNKEMELIPFRTLLSVKCLFYLCLSFVFMADSYIREVTHTNQFDKQVVTKRRAYSFSMYFYCFIWITFRVLFISKVYRTNNNHIHFF